jgi:predicted nuclease of predicted toxin-antitoxin system
MKIVIDENVSYGLVERLRMRGHEVISVSELAERGNYNNRKFS